MKTDHEMEQALKALRWSPTPETDRRILEDAQRALGQTRSHRPVVIAARLLAAAALVVLVVAGTLHFRSPGPEKPTFEFTHVHMPYSPQEDSAPPLSLAKLTSMSADPDRLLDYLDAHSRPLRPQGESPLSAMKLNGTWN